MVGMRGAGRIRRLGLAFHFDGRASEGEAFACVDAMEAKLLRDAYDALTLVGTVELARALGRSY